MIVGDPMVFAIESQITVAYASLSLRALGSYRIVILGRYFGIDSLDATNLACSLDAVEKRLAARGQHTVPFGAKCSADEIARAVRVAIYDENQDDLMFFNMGKHEFSELIYSRNIIWAPDGDEAFDDRSYVLHFDLGSKVRLIAFRSESDGYEYEPGSLVDATIVADTFYDTLSKWRDAFKAEWAATIKD